MGMWEVDDSKSDGNWQGTDQRRALMSCYLI